MNRFSLLSLSGLAAGWVAAMTVPVTDYAVTTVCLPAAPPGGASPEWLQAEAAALTSPATIQRVVQDLNLADRWDIPAADCAARLQGEVTVRVASGIPGLHIATRGEQPETARAMARALTNARETILAESALAGYHAQQSDREARANSLRQSIAARFAPLVAAVQKSQPGAVPGEEAVLAADLPPELIPLRAAWQSEKRQLAWLEESAPPERPPEATLKAGGEPVRLSAAPGPANPRTVPWSLAGAAAGAAAAFTGSRRGRRNTPPALP